MLVGSGITLLSVLSTLPGVVLPRLALTRLALPGLALPRLDLTELAVTVALPELALPELALLKTLLTVSVTAVTSARSRIGGVLFSTGTSTSTSTVIAGISSAIATVAWLSTLRLLVGSLRRIALAATLPGTSALATASARTTTSTLAAARTGALARPRTTAVCWRINPFGHDDRLSLAWLC